VHARILTALRSTPLRSAPLRSTPRPPPTWAEVRAARAWAPPGPAGRARAGVWGPFAHRTGRDALTAQPAGASERHPASERRPSRARLDIPGAIH
jgi:hypothetical protein